MKKKISLLSITLFVFFLFFYSCSKNEGNGVAPTYKSEGTSTGNNPYNPPATT